MLQKYHPNPLSHFLALHNSQATHNHVQQQHQQQQQLHSPILHSPLDCQTTNPNLRQPNTPPTHRHTQQLIEEAAATVSTTLDAGKSFTIAAILGLQKSAMESSCKEYTNNVINLSLNGGSSNCTKNNNNSNNEETVNGHDDMNGQKHQQNLATPEHRHTDELQTHLQQQQLHHPHHLTHANLNSNNNHRDVTNLNVNKSVIPSASSSTTSLSSNICHNIMTSVAAAANTVNNNCDSVPVATSAAANVNVLMNRYLPSAMVNVTGSAFATTTPAMSHQQHSRANSFVAAAAAAAAAAANVPGAPSALQSLQQLHQQHAAAHQSNLSFQREKLKAGSSKKSSLKNKRVRTIFTPEQLERLEAEFERQQYMVGPERLYLAHTLQLTEAQVKVWFQNRRIKWRKHHLEITQQRLALLRQTQIVPGNSTDQTTVKVDGTDDDDEDCDNIKREELRDLREDSRQDTESELSVCNDSMDAESILDDEEET
uniref:Uncharacterized protein n=1 Tax=Musca domestica TaxID=7370 RepID=A0A1I8MU38_MUSDO